MSRGVLPTTDLYFANGCREWIARWWRKGPIRRLGANCFVHENRLLLIRRDTPAVVERALAWPGELIYLIDDDIDGAALSLGLPPAYRDRLASFAMGDYDRLMRRADRVVVSSAALAEKLAQDARVGARPDVLDPFWACPIARPDHFAAGRGDRLDVVHLGSGSHQEGLRLATPAILAMLDGLSHARFSFFSAPGNHSALEAHPQARRLAPMAWRRYRRWLPRQRFHLGLYPLAPEAFDRTRSANKLIEHGVIGAVGFYPGDWPSAQHASNAILAPSDPAEWKPALLAAAADRAGLARRCADAPAALARFTDPQRQRRFWVEAFGCTEP